MEEIELTSAIAEENRRILNDVTCKRAALTFAGHPIDPKIRIENPPNIPV
jgi:hypothetical protein